MRGKRAAQQSSRHRDAIAIADDRHELRSARSPPGSAGVSPTCSLTGGSKSASGRPARPFAPCGSMAGRSQSRATEMNFGLRWRRLGAQASRPPARRRRAHPGHLHLQWEKGVAHRDRFFGKPLRAISHFSRQDAQPPPSPRVGEGGRGDEGQRCAGIQNVAHLSQKLYPCEQGGCGATARRSSVITVCVALPHEWLAD